MAGMGPAPKDPAKRARNNPDPVPQKVIPLIRAEAPELPTLVDWHWRTRDWWSMWTRSALARDFSEADWDFLVDTALIHSAFWNGDLKQAAELRLRVAKFGVTPEDRARLRIVFAEADEKDEKRAGGGKPSGAYGNLRAVKTQTPDPNALDD